MRHRFLASVAFVATVLLVPGRAGRPDRGRLVDATAYGLG